jgi:hypothetical protein
MQKLQIIAGPCSVDNHNVEQIYQILEMQEVYGTRIIGLKSRTGLDKSGHGMGMDYEEIVDMIANGTDAESLPSIEIAKRIHEDTGAMIASEIMIPHIQMNLFAKAGIGKGKLLAWNPAINQLGWSTMQMTLAVKENNWIVGLKNPKWLGEDLNIAEDNGFLEQTSLQKQWLGQVMYAQDADEIILIHRGVDVPQKGDFRNALIHNQSKSTKVQAQKLLPEKEIKLFFDPSHTYGPKLRDQIPGAVIEAMQMRENESDKFLYDGILIEVGDSQTDTEQHITVDELRMIIDKVGEFREFMHR